VTARILEVDAEAYHALDLFSPSVATTLISRSPLHALTLRGKAPNKVMDRGSVMHAMILGDGKKFVALNYDDWRTKEAREQREVNRAKGLIPILKHELDDADKAAIAILSRLRSMGVRLDGKSEAAIEWEESTAHGPVKCKTMVDHLRLDAGEMLELKIVDDASPDRCERTAENLGYAIACAARTRALTALKQSLAGRTRYRFLFCEAVPPYAIYAPYPTGEFREIGERKWLRAVESWARCQASGKWAAYEAHDSIHPPGWAMAKEGHASDE
jgi:hypothetical protein